jgi:hypothetical protein
MRAISAGHQPEIGRQREGNRRQQREVRWLAQYCLKNKQA